MAVRNPTPFGENVISKSTSVPGVTVAGLGFRDTENSVGLEDVMLVKFTSAEPSLLTWNVFGAEELPITVAAKTVL